MTIRRLSMIALATCLAGPVSAAEVKVLTAGAMKAVVLEVVTAFTRDTGHTVVVDNDTVGGLARRITAGEPFDVTIVTPKIVEDLTAAGKIIAGTRADVAQVGMGVAIKAGTLPPDLSSADAFKALLLKVTSIAYIDPIAGGSSGIYFDKLIDRLGVGEQVRAKAKLKTGGYVAEAVVTGEAEIAVHQISEIVPVAGAQLAGPLPAAVQNTTVYSAGLGAAARDATAARAFLAALATPATAALLRAKGMERP
jgi:molybdate transport system substrate-binding protein